MDATANTFTKQSNARRAAEAMIAKGTAPASEYVIKRIDNPGRRDNNRFEIVWRTEEAETAVTEADVAAAEENWSRPATGEVESEIAGEEFPCERCDRREACQDAGLCLQGQTYTAPTTTEAIEAELAAPAEGADPFARIRASEEIQALGTTPEKYWYGETPASTEAAAEPAAAPGGRETGEAAPQPAPSAEAAPERTPAPAEGEPEPEFPVGAYVHVQMGKLRIRAGHITQRVGHANRRVHLLGAAEGVTQLVNLAQLYRVEEKPMPPEEPKPARQSRRDRAPAAPQGSRSRYGIDPDLIAAGRLPDKAPEVTSAANRRYQTHFDKLLALATAGDWDGVRKYEITGSNSYSKMVARYRQDLLAVHAAQQTAAAQPEYGQ
jgi:hypothetical protein